MAQLVPIDPKFISANWSSTLARFTVTAKSISGRIATAEFKRVLEFTGGRKLRLEGFFGGGNPDALPFGKTYTEEKVTTKPSPSGKILVVHADLTTKKETTSDLVVTTDVSAPTPVPSQPAQPDVPTVALKPQPMPSSQPKIDASAVVLQPINVDLPKQNFVRIMAAIPNPAILRSTVEGRNEPDPLYTWRSGVTQGQAYWDVAWSWSADSSTKGMFTVTTTQSALNQTNGPTQITVQQYTVKCLSKVMVDLSDPNA